MMRFLERRAGRLPDAVKAEMMTPGELGFYTTLTLAGAEMSLAAGETNGDGVTSGRAVDLVDVAIRELGEGVAAEYGLGMSRAR